MIKAGSRNWRTRSSTFAATAGSSPSGRFGCAEGATISDGVITIPIEVVRYRDYVEPIIQMCFDGKGPYPMALDTGAAESVIRTA